MDEKTKSMSVAVFIELNFIFSLFKLLLFFVICIIPWIIHGPLTTLNILNISCYND